MMKRLIVLFFMIGGFIAATGATERGEQQRLSKEEFRNKQQAYITEKAGLSKEEAARFFPVYFELQDRKNQLNEDAWELIQKGRNEKTTEEQYAEIMEGVYDTRIAADRLEKTYFSKFKKILSCKKIYLIQKAEMRFRRDMLKDMRPEKGTNPPPAHRPNRQK